MFQKDKTMNIIKKAYKKYKIRKMRKELEGQAIEPTYRIVHYREDGKKEIWIFL